MSYTKKQLSAFRSILSRCPKNVSGMRTAEDGGETVYLVTDGACCVVLPEQPEGFTSEEPGGLIYRCCKGQLENGGHTLAAVPVTPDDCREEIRLWKENLKKDPSREGKTRPAVLISGEASTRWYDARLVLDALESVGPKARQYVGSKSLLITPDLQSPTYAIVMPIRR